jgi:hypothetical protein
VEAPVPWHRPRPEAHEEISQALGESRAVRDLSLLTEEIRQKRNKRGITRTSSPFTSIGHPLSFVRMTDAHVKQAGPVSMRDLPVCQCGRGAPHTAPTRILGHEGRTLFRR